MILMKNNSFTFAFLTVLVISLVIASTPTINPKTTITATTTLNSKTNGQGDLVTVPESTNAVNLDGQITPEEWSDAYNVGLTLYTITDQWEAEFWIKYNDSHILMAEKIDDPAVNVSGAFMIMVGIVIDLFIIHGQDIMGVAGNPYMGTILTFDMFQPPEQDPQFDTDYVDPPGTNDVSGNTSYDDIEGPSAEWARPLYTGDIYDHSLTKGMLFFVTGGYNDGYQPEDSPAQLAPEDTLMFTLERFTVPYSTTPVDFDDDIDVISEWGDAFYVPSILLSNGTETWFLDLWMKFNYTHLLFAMNISNPTTAGNFTFLGLIENLLTFDITYLSTDLFGILGDISNDPAKTETYDLYFSGPRESAEVQNDTDLGGTNDTYGATYYSSITGPQAEFCHPLNSSDPNDEALQPGSTFLGMLGYGDGWWHFGVDRPPVLSPSGAFVLEEPVIDSPPDIIIEQGSTGNSIIWHPRALNHLMYNVTIDDSVVDSGFWDGGDITIDLDVLSLSLGIYDFTCGVNVTYGNSTSNSVNVQVVDTSNPIFIDPPDDITYEEDTTGHYITWTPSDANPAYYNVTLDGGWHSGDLWDGTSITIGIDGLADGIYTYICGVNDTEGNSASDTVIVTVTSSEVTPPTFIDPPADITYELGTTGHSITWDPVEANPNLYNITQDGALVASGEWDGGDIFIDLDALGLTPGTYIFICGVNDSYGNSAIDSVTVQVNPDTTTPTIDEPDDITYLEGETGKNITWHPQDLNPNMYNITQDGALVASGEWDGGIITIDLDALGLTPGTYVFVCSVNDTNGNSVSDEVTVTVTAPEEVSEFSYGYAFIALVALPLLALITYRKTKKLRT